MSSFQGDKYEEKTEEMKYIHTYIDALHTWSCFEGMYYIVCGGKDKKEQEIFRNKMLIKECMYCDIVQ